MVKPDSGIDGFLGIFEIVGKLERKPEIERDLPYPVFRIKQHIIGLGKGWQVSWRDIEDF